MDLFSSLINPTTNLLPCDGVVNYYASIIEHAVAKSYFNVLYNTIEWKHDEANLFGKRIITNRKVAWYGDSEYAYTYSNTTKKALIWTKELLELKAIVEKAKNAGASYVMPMFGVTLRKGSRDYLFKAFDEKFPGMKEQYQQQFGEQYECNSPHSKQLYETFYELIYKYGMTPKMKFYEPEPDNQLTLF